MMDFKLSEEQELLQDSVAKFIRDEYSLDVRRQLCEAGVGSWKVIWERYAELGILSLCLPSDIAGFEFDFTDITVVIEQLAGGAIIEPFVENVVYAANILGSCQSISLREDLLIDMAAGRSTVAVVLEDESERLRSGKSSATTARIEQTGKIHISGHKILVLGASSCDHLIVEAEFMESREKALILIGACTHGVKIESYNLIDGSVASDIYFNDVVADPNSVIARGEEVEAITSMAYDKLLLGRMAEALGVMEASLSLTSEYVKERKQFGRPIGGFQVIQHILADMFVWVQASRSIFYHGMSKLNDSKIEREKAVSSAKYLICKNGLSVTAAAIQLHGGYGITDEYMVSHLYKRMVLIDLLCGDSSHHISRISR